VKELLAKYDLKCWAIDEMKATTHAAKAMGWMWSHSLWDRLSGNTGIRFPRLPGK
jgi:hypothetical protein